MRYISGISRIHLKKHILFNCINQHLVFCFHIYIYIYIYIYIDKWNFKFIVKLASSSSIPYVIVANKNIKYNFTNITNFEREKTKSLMLS